MKFTPIASSSHGNAYLIADGDSRILLECGIPYKRLQEALDYKVQELEACFITHEHKDHAGYINEVLKATVPVYASAGTIENTPIEGPRRANVCKAGTLFTLGGFRIIPFGTKHDSAEPLGFFINHEETGNILFATDTYYLPCKFAGLNNVLIECNYRLDLLDANIAAGRIPAVVRNRTLKSHLSYDHCVQALQANDIKGVNNIVLIHLSDGNSNAEQFRAGVRAATGKTVHIAEAGLIINFDKTPF